MNDNEIKLVFDPLPQYLVFVSPGHAVEVVVESFLPMELVKGEAGGELTLICKMDPD